MRFSDAKRPAMSWEEAALSPAEARTLSGGAALKTVQKQQEERLGEAEARALLSPPEAQNERPAAPAQPEAARGMGRAALNEVMRRIRR